MEQVDEDQRKMTLSGSSGNSNSIPFFYLTFLSFFSRPCVVPEDYSKTRYSKGHILKVRVSGPSEKEDLWNSSHESHCTYITSLHELSYFTMFYSSYRNMNASGESSTSEVAEVQSCGVHGECRAPAYTGGLGTESPVGSRDNCGQGAKLLVTGSGA